MSIRILLLFLCLTNASIYGQKIFVNGVSFVAPPNKIQAEVFDPVVALEANWITLMPYAYCRENSTKVHFEYQGQYWGESVKGTAKCIEMAHAKNLKVLLKPHVWMRGVFTGDFHAGTEEDWKDFEKEYSNYILTFAKLADSMKVGAFCIGVELKTFALNRPDYWRRLIQEVREIYHGPITYAANWDSFNYIQFWNDLDFIGIDAYFPLSEEKSPSKASIIQAWQPYIEEMEKLHKKFQIPVVFTEYGYRSRDFSLKEPWDSEYSSSEEANHEIQSTAYLALFEALDEKDWFLGGFVWKWFHNHQHIDGQTNNRFSPQNKPAEKTLREIHQTRIRKFN